MYLEEWADFFREISDFHKICQTVHGRSITHGISASHFGDVVPLTYEYGRRTAILVDLFDIPFVIKLNCICLFSWRYNPVVVFSQPGSGLVFEVS